MNMEIVSHNRILQSKGMIELRLIGFKGIISILRKVIMSLLSPLGGSPSGPFLCRVNVMGYELDMEPLYMNLNCKLLYENEG